jgi:hypothetical protein
MKTISRTIAFSTLRRGAVVERYREAGGEVTVIAIFLVLFPFMIVLARQTLTHTSSESRYYRDC